MYGRILLPTDGSELSRKAVHSAIALAALLGSELIVLYVAHRYPMSYMERGITISGEDVARIEKQWADHGQWVVHTVEAAAAKAGVEARGQVVQSDLIAETIQAVAEKDKCDLVVMASHGRKGVARLLLGSETLHVLTHGKVPVLVVR